MDLQQIHFHDNTSGVPVTVQFENAVHVFIVDVELDQITPGRVVAEWLRDKKWSDRPFRMDVLSDQTMIVIALQIEGEEVAFLSYLI